MMANHGRRVTAWGPVFGPIYAGEPQLKIADWSTSSVASSPQSIKSGWGYGFRALGLHFVSASPRNDTALGHQFAAKYRLATAISGRSEPEPSVSATSFA